MNELDVLKSIEDIARVDSRTQMTMSYFDLATQTQKVFDLPGHHATIAELTLNANVPDEVAVSFEVAKNLYLYTFFVYRFGVVANVQALQSLEYALREKAIQAGLYKEQMLGALMRLAMNRKWLTDEAFTAIPDFRPPGKNRYSKTLAKTLPDMRNILAHGSFTLFEPHRALDQLRICHAIINFVFR